MASLDDYLARMASVPFTWGAVDCAKFIAGWMVEAGKPDFSKQFGAYDEARAEEMIDDFGGVLGVAEHGLQSLPVTTEPQRGDVGVVRVFGVPEPFMAIYTGKRWAMKADGGILTARATCLKAWSVGHG